MAEEIQAQGKPKRSILGILKLIAKILAIIIIYIYGCV